ncbi:DsbA family protein [Natrialba aegyptia]|uniref:DSBA oxidoreductase n=1 Tax=Natrialba aegyptia DSM 13077 TaxID=1227491 RepID=M0AJ76_9EURY|nr:DsbA family protein [Natrialba aegyptia]ELY98770.1 DSBA oxidoreductase [Natrialba aegyptia DSM 13077]
MSGDPTRSAVSQLVVPVTEDDHQQGPDDAPVTLVEYGDYQCSYCGQAYPLIKDVQEQFGDDLRFVFRNFPLTSIHEYAQHAAEAAEAAGGQGEEEFWSMHDLLYENQDALDDESLITYAEQLGLDPERFRSDFASHAFEDRIHEQFVGGARSGVNGTPTFYINGERYDGSWSPSPLSTAIQRVLSSSR